AALIQNYGTLDNLLAHRDEVPGAMGRNLRASIEAVNTARRLIALRSDTDLGRALDTAGWRESPEPELREILSELGFKKFLSAIDELWPDSANQSPQAPPSPTSRAKYVLVNSEAKFGEFLTELSKQKAIALDTETTGLNPLQAQLVGMSFSWQAGQAYYLPFRAFLGQNTLATDKHLPRLRQVLEDQSIAKYGHNIKYDLLILKSAGIELAGIVFDTMVASYLLESDRPSHSLKALGRDLLGMEVTEITELIGKGQKQIGFDEVPLEQACDYAARDADMTWQLQQLLSKHLGPAGLEKLFHDVEIPLVEVLAQMEFNGIKLDEKILRQMSRDLEKQSHQLLDDIHRQAGEHFNVDSPQQLADILFNKLGLKPVRKTKTGFSTDVSVLEKLRQSHPLPGLVLQYRQIAKLRNTYLDVLPKMVSPKTSRIHASFNQTMTATGRLSSSGPNLQNIPARNELGRQVRAAFVPALPENVLLRADYSQIELRVLAHFSKDQQLCQAFASDEDIHSFVASQVFGVDPQNVTSDQRSQAKTVNFGIIYGQTPFGLAQSLGISTSEAHKFIEEYHQRYQGIRWFLEKCVKQAQETGFVQTILSRRRRIRNIHASNRAEKGLAERTAINTVVQGSAADLMKVAMVNVHDYIKKNCPQVKLLLQIHDELLFELPRSEAAQHAQWIRRLMSQAIPLSVPVVVDIAWGRNWLESKYSA
ncbi:MAG: DNA polymerase I, partial [Phycisphaerae bacterium]|nr:DNA polymerase I [Phycisphaerae bacterium]